jgi:hypothetical protein
LLLFDISPAGRNPEETSSKLLCGLRAAAHSSIRTFFRSRLRETGGG